MGTRLAHDADDNQDAREKYSFVQFLYVAFRIALWLVVRPLVLFRVGKFYLRGGNFADMDFYLMTMAALIYGQHKNQQVMNEDRVIFRNDFRLDDAHLAKLRAWVKKFASKHYSLEPWIAKYLEKLDIFPADFLEWIADPKVVKLDADQVKISDDGTIRVIGPAHLTGFWEDFLLAKLNLLYQEQTGQSRTSGAWLVRAWQKARYLKANGALVAEFGTRRRAGFMYQLFVLLAFIASGSQNNSRQPGGLMGTSNVFLAAVLGLKPIGTVAHRLFMLEAGLYGVQYANLVTTELWQNLYGNKLSAGLPDTFTTDQYFKDLPKELFLSLTSLRQDSGDPIKFARKLVAHYKSLGLSDEEIKQKTIIFSDGLDAEQAVSLLRYSQGLGIGAAFGIGTSLTNDVDGIKPLSVVFKLFGVWLHDKPDDVRFISKLGDGPLSGPASKVSADARVSAPIIHWVKTGDTSQLPPPLLELPAFLAK